MTWAGVLADDDQRMVGDEHRDLACHQLSGLGALAFVERGLDGQLVQPELGVDHRVRRDLIGGSSRPPPPRPLPAWPFPPPAAGGVTIAELSGELDLACAQRCVSSFSACSGPALAGSSSTCSR
jgi:hypothetical protein